MNEDRGRKGEVREEREGKENKMRMEKGNRKEAEGINIESKK